MRLPEIRLDFRDGSALALYIRRLKVAPRHEPAAGLGRLFRPLIAITVTATTNVGRIDLPSRAGAPGPRRLAVSAPRCAPAHLDSPPQERNKDRALRPKLTLQASKELVVSGQGSS